MSRDTRRFDGLLLFTLGAVATIAPLFSSVWGLPIVGAAIFLSGIVELADAWFSGDTRTHYSSGVFSVLAGALISFQSAFAFSGLMVLLSLVLLADGAVTVVRAARGNHAATHGAAAGHRLWDVINGAANIALGLFVWLLRDSVGPLGFGILLGLRMAASGWQTMFAPSPSDADLFTRLEDHHPNRALGLEPHPIIGFIHREAIADAASRTPTDLYWSVIDRSALASACWRNPRWRLAEFFRARQLEAKAEKCPFDSLRTFDRLGGEPGRNRAR